MIPSAPESCTVKLKLPWGSREEGGHVGKGPRKRQDSWHMAAGLEPRVPKALSNQSWNDGKGVEDGHDDVHRHGILPPKITAF